MLVIYYYYVNYWWFVIYYNKVIDTYRIRIIITTTGSTIGSVGIRMRCRRLRLLLYLLRIRYSLRLRSSVRWLQLSGCISLIHASGTNRCCCWMLMSGADGAPLMMWAITRVGRCLVLCGHRRWILSGRHAAGARCWARLAYAAPTTAKRPCTTTGTASVTGLK